MKILKVNNWDEIPKNYTGIAEYPNNSKEWLVNGKYHREDGPAVDHGDGYKAWYLNGVVHREDGPAIERADGEKHWCLNGVYHREDGPAREWLDGTKQWWLNGACLFCLPLESQPFIFIEEFVDEEGKEKIKVLNQKGVEIWKNVPGLKELADNHTE